MTERLYYGDSLLLEFDATVVDVREHEGRTAIVLDRTAFYPTSGGQPFDTGMLGSARVVDVIDDEESGDVLHVLDTPLEKGASVRGQIDRARRLDHMQQHTGQHVLSAAFDHAHNARTLSFHLGSESSTIDLDREIGADGVAEAERIANAVVWDDRAVAIRYATEAEAAAMPLRKESKRTGTLRLIDVPDCDLSACGGTHVPRTGVIGIIAVTGTERFKGGMRVSFVCGGRALATFRRMRTAVDETARRLSVHPDELPATIERLQEEAKALRQTIRAQQERLAAAEADALKGRADGTIVVEHMPGWDANGIKHVAIGLVAPPGRYVAGLIGDGAPAPVVIACPEGVAVDAGAVLKQLTAELGGKGGGRPSMAQGAVSAPAAAAVARLRDLLRAALG